MPDTDWIAICAHTLHVRWRTVAPDVLEDAARELLQDERLRCMPPREAAQAWLQPLTTERPPAR